MIQLLSEAPLNFSAITGPSAPYHFRICRRCHEIHGHLHSLCHLWLRRRRWKAVKVPRGLGTRFFLAQWVRSSFSIQPGPGDFQGRSSKQFEKMFSEKRQLHMKKTILRPFLTTRSNGTMQRHQNYRNCGHDSKLFFSVNWYYVVTVTWFWCFLCY